ncbi:MAG: OstA-like protein [Thermonemataceae bacterium]|nr:OstA-like protein [Thermonemataceae bacterium]
MKSLFYCLILALFSIYFSSQPLLAQKKKPAKLLKPKKPALVKEQDTVRYEKLPYDTLEYKDGEKLELLSGAAFGEGFNGGDSLVKVVGRNISFKHGERYIFCDSAYFYPKKNFVKAMGNVQIAEEGASTISAKNMDFDANTGTLKARGDANFTREETNLRAPAIDYNVNSKIAYYFGGGVMSNGKTDLKSESGSFDTGTKNLFAKEKVVARGTDDNGEPFELKGDTLIYNDFTKWMRWKGKKAQIKTASGIINSDDGEFNTKTKKMKLKGTKNQVENEEYIIKGDKVDFDDRQGEGYMKGNVEIFSKKDNIFINSGEAEMKGQQGINRFYGGRPYLRMIDEQKDTLWVVADTLISIGNKLKDSTQEAQARVTEPDSTLKTKRKKLLLAYHNVKVYKSDLQAICDSLTYNFKDSVIYFYTQPIMWSSGSQISADSLHILTKNNQPDKIILRENAFAITQDSVGNYNQMKGKYMDAFLKNGKMDKILVNGNSECIYFQLEEEDKSLIGMYKIICGSVKAEFELGKELSVITFYKQADGTITPPHELQEEAKRLPGFSWEQEVRPNRATILEPPKQRKKIEKKKTPSTPKNDNTKLQEQSTEEKTKKISKERKREVKKLAVEKD